MGAKTLLHIESSPIENVLKYLLSCCQGFLRWPFLDHPALLEGDVRHAGQLLRVVSVALFSSPCSSFNEFTFKMVFFALALPLKQVCASVLRHPRRLPSLHPRSFQERCYHTSGDRPADCRHLDLVGFDEDDVKDGHSDEFLTTHTWTSRDH